MSRNVCKELLSAKKFKMCFLLSGHFFISNHENNCKIPFYMIKSILVLRIKKNLFLNYIILSISENNSCKEI